MKRVVALGVFCLLAFGSVGASAAEDFYKGKVLSIITSGTTGSYEAYSRLIAKHIPKYIPGTPTAIVKSMSGASGLKAANYMYSVAPKDGTEIAGTHGHIPTFPVFTSQGIQYDPTKFEWIGNASKESYVAYMWKTAPVQSMEDARAKEAIVGGQAVGSMSVDIPVLANAMMGTKFKIVGGYAGTAETRLAVQRGEVHGHAGTAYRSILAETPDWITNNNITFIAQFGRKKLAVLPNVPMLYDYVIDPEDRRALELFLARQETGKPYFAPPGTPPDRVAILRRAFEAILKDPGFMAEAEAASLDIVEPMTGDELSQFVNQMMKTPASYAKRIEDIFTKYGEQK